MSTAFAYARVSTKDQATKDNSIPEQFSRIERYADQEGIKILRTYRDSDSAYHDENREQFKAMVADAINIKPNYIIIDDSSRFARTRKTAIETKDLLRKNGINIRFVNEPFVDPKSVAGLWLEGIQEIKNEATSREIAFHVTKGMTRNICNRDHETGWCYKNGGKAPFGYIITYLTRGQDSSGKPMLKSIWELHPENSKVVREIIVDMYISKQMSYKEIRDKINVRGITCRSGGHWSTATVVSMLEEHRLQQYAGIAIWNRGTRSSKGKKKSKEEWVYVDNAHPSIITKDELEMALLRKVKNKSGAPAGATRNSNNLFTGNNFEGKPIFTCANCGGNVIGYGNASKNWAKYVCGVHRTKGELACNSNWLVDRGLLENSILDEIEKRYISPNKVEELVKDISSSIKTKNTEIDETITSMQKQVSKRNTEIQRLLDAIKSGIEPALVTDEVNKVKKERDELEEKIKLTSRSYSQEHNVDIEVIRKFFLNFRIAFENGTMKERRELVRTFVRNIDLVPETKEIRVEFYPDHLVQSLCYGEPYHKYTLWQGRDTRGRKLLITTHRSIINRCRRF